MSNEQIIRSWKDEELGEQDERGAENLPENPAGAYELHLEDREERELGIMPETFHLISL